MKTALNWVMLLVGFSTGVFALAVLGLRGEVLQRGEWREVIGLATLGIVPILASSVALRNRFVAALLYFVTAPMIVVWFRWPPDDSVAAALTVAVVLFAAPGAFWFITEKYHWPGVTFFQNPSLIRRLAVIFATTLVLFTIVSVVKVVMGAWQEYHSFRGPGALYIRSAVTDLSLLLLFMCLVFVFLGVLLLAVEHWCSSNRVRLAFRNAVNYCLSGVLLLAIVSLVSIGMAVRRPVIGDCFSEKPPSAAPRYPGNAALQVKVLHVGVLFGAVAIVQQQFWGLPRWYPRLVFLNWGRAGESFFIEGHRESGLLTRFLPVVWFHPGCSRSALVEDAPVDIRLAKDGPPKSGIRIIGRVVKRVHAPHRTQAGVPDVVVVIASEHGSIVTQTDQQGIYDVRDLPPGRYTVRLEADSSVSCGWAMRQPELKAGDIWGCAMILDGGD